jgi:hypothetical protein
MLNVVMLCRDAKLTRLCLAHFFRLVCCVGVRKEPTQVEHSTVPQYATGLGNGNYQNSLQHNYIQHNETEHNDIQFRSICHKDIQHNAN